MAMLEPKLSILDETDSGLDVDAFAYRGRRFQQIAYAGNFGFGHHPLPTFVGLPQAGCGARAARRTHREKRRSELAVEIENKGFDWIKAETSAV